MTLRNIKLQTSNFKEPSSSKLQKRSAAFPWILNFEGFFEFWILKFEVFSTVFIRD